jgi:hypothetical protein
MRPTGPRRQDRGNGGSAAGKLDWIGFRDWRRGEYGGAEGCLILANERSYLSNSMECGPLQSRHGFFA